MEMQMTTVAIFSWGSGLEANTLCMYYPIKTFSTATVCLFHAYLLTFPCFFGDAIEDIYNKYTSLSIYQKKEFIYFCTWPAMPYCHIQIHCGH